VSYPPQRCADCGQIIDVDDPDFNEADDDKELCGLCNLHYREQEA
jgi:hypothetical protein